MTNVPPEAKQLAPEQWDRDPTGELARITVEALKSTIDLPPTIRYVHGGKCGGLVAQVGPTSRGEMLTTFRQSYAPPPQSPLEALRRQFELPPGEVTKSGGLTYHDGRPYLLDEPTGFAAPPETVAVLCQKCRTEGELGRARVLEDLIAASPSGGTRRIHLAL